MTPHALAVAKAAASLRTGDTRLAVRRLGADRDEAVRDDVERDGAVRDPFEEERLVLRDRPDDDLGAVLVATAEPTLTARGGTTAEGGRQTTRFRVAGGNLRSAGTRCRPAPKAD